MKSAMDMSANIGKLALFNTEGLRVMVRIKDARVRFGTIDYLIKPVEGGPESIWVSSSRVSVDQGTYQFGAQS